MAVIHQHLKKPHKEGQHDEVAGFEEFGKLLQMVKIEPIKINLRGKKVADDLVMSSVR